MRVSDTGKEMREGNRKCSFSPKNRDNGEDKKVGVGSRSDKGKEGEKQQLTAK